MPNIRFMHGKLLDFRSRDGVLGEDRSLWVQQAFNGQKLKSLPPTTSPRFMRDHTLKGSVRLCELRHAGNHVQNWGGIETKGGPTLILQYYNACCKHPQIQSSLIVQDFCLSESFTLYL